MVIKKAVNSMKIYIPNYTSGSGIGGGWSWLRNFQDGLRGKVQFVDKYFLADIYFIFSITATRTGEIEEAKKGGRKIVLRVDNIPRKSRNHRMDAAGRLSEIGALADLVVYQSEWAKNYAGYLIKNKSNEKIIRNGVNTDVFNTKNRKSDGHTYLYFNYNDNPNKRFDEALYWFDMAWRKDNQSHLVVGGSAPSMYLQHPEWNWDLPIKGQLVSYVGVIDNAFQAAALMKSCDYLLIPYFAEASSNTLLEGLACGLKPIAVNPEGGNIEIIKDCAYCFYYEATPVRSIHMMAKSYLEEFNKLLKK